MPPSQCDAAAIATRSERGARVRQAQAGRQARRTMTVLPPASTRTPHSLNSAPLALVFVTVPVSEPPDYTPARNAPPPLRKRTAPLKGLPAKRGGGARLTLPTPSASPVAVSSARREHDEPPPGGGSRRQ